MARVTDSGYQGETRELLHRGGRRFMSGTRDSLEAPIIEVNEKLLESKRKAGVRTQTFTNEGLEMNH